jgi:P27 family predicted phage terminase small subunit
MKSGPPPLATQTKRDRGNPGKRRLNEAEPAPRIGMPEQPANLSDEAAVHWPVFGSELLAIRVLTVADSWALGQLCEAYADYIRTRDILAAEGEYQEVKTQFGSSLRAHPALAIKIDADKRLRAWISEFGLTPAQRTRVKAAPPQDGERAARRQRYFGDRAG